MFKTSVPISHLFQNEKYAESLMENSDCLELRDENIYTVYPNRELFHCEMQPIHRLDKKDFQYLQEVKDMHPDLKLVTFHCASLCDKPYIENNIFQVGGNEYRKHDLLKNAKYNLMKIKKVFGKDIKIGLENNNYYPSKAYEYITDPEFISDIIYENGVYFLFDIAHAKITVRNKNIDYEEYRNKLPIDKLVQLHIASYSIGEDGMAYDTHNYPGEEEFNEIKEIIGRYDVEYLTVEYYKDIKNLLMSLKKIKRIRNGFYKKAF